MQGEKFIPSKELIIQLILLKDGDIKAKKDFDTLSNQIESEFLKKVHQAYNQLDVFDSLISTDSGIMEQLKGMN